MPNIVDYLGAHGGDSFRDRPLCAVDCLILSELSYSDLPASDAMPFKDALSIASDTMYLKKDGPLRDAVAAAPRFRDAVFQDFVDEFDPDEEKQFSAFTLLIGDGSHCVVFRGTDSSFVGWKEDFNLAFAVVVPSQADAARYLAAVAQKTAGPIRVMGHSKGGNLAIYAAATAPDNVRARLTDVYSFDGPGQNETVAASEGLRAVSDRIRFYVPESSVVGMLFSAPDTRKVVRAKGYGLFQHNPFLWQTDGADFAYAENTTRTSAYFTVASRRWFASLPKEKRRAYVESLYRVMTSGDLTSFDEILKNVRRAEQLLRALSRKEGENEDAKMLREMLSSFLRAALDSLRDTLSQP